MCEKCRNFNKSDKIRKFAKSGERKFFFAKSIRVKKLSKNLEKSKNRKIRLPKTQVFWRKKEIIYKFWQIKEFLQKRGVKYGEKPRFPQ